MLQVSGLDVMTQGFVADIHMQAPSLSTDSLHQEFNCIELKYPILECSL